LDIQIDTLESCRGKQTPECLKGCPVLTSCHDNKPLVLYFNGTGNSPSNYRKATFKDFSFGEVPSEECSHFSAAAVYVGFYYNYHVVNGKQSLYFYQYLSACSYIHKDDLNKVTLAHEQLHIDIYTVCYMMLFKNIQQHVNTMKNPLNLQDVELTQLVSKWDTECRGISHRMDDETHHGHKENKVEEQRWRNFIASKLLSLQNLDELYSFHAITESKLWWWWK
jgi:hypothetical protein